MYAAVFTVLSTGNYYGKEDKVEIQNRAFEITHRLLLQQETKEWVYQKQMKNYRRCVASVDDNAGRVPECLDQSGLAENTVVICTSGQGFFPWITVFRINGLYTT